VLLRKAPLRHDSEPESGSRAPLLPQKAANLGTAFSLRQTARHGLQPHVRHPLLPQAHQFLPGSGEAHSLARSFTGLVHLL